MSEQMNIDAADTGTLAALDRQAAAIEQLTKRIDQLQQSMNEILDTKSQIPNFIAIAADSGDDLLRRSESEGLDPDERIQNLAQLLERVSRRETLDKLDQLLILSEKAPGIVSILIDSFDKGIEQAENSGFDLIESISAASDLLSQLSSPDLMRKVQSLLTLSTQLPDFISILFDSIDQQITGASEQGIDPDEMVGLVRDSVYSLSDAINEPPKNIKGIFSLYKLMKDPDIQTGLGFLANFLKKFGNTIQKNKDYVTS